MACSSLAAAPTPNTLTQAEADAGWQLMFDGASLAGWHSYQKTSISENGWILRDSSIYMRGPAAGALLAPEKFVYRNFEISIDWKIPEGGNSGIFLRYLETEPSENIRTGPETQICGKLHPDYKSGMTATSPGACYAMYAPATPWTMPSDQYNTFHVVMYEKRVAHFGNGIRLLEYEMGSPDWLDKYGKSKYASFPLYGDVHAGKLFLQDHASSVWYRNIKIRPLTKDPWTDKNFAWPDRTMRISLRPGSARAPALRITREGGRPCLQLSRNANWDLRLDDAGGNRLGVFQGSGSGNQSLASRGTAGLQAGTYFLSGLVDGAPFSQAFFLAPDR
ncbi:MAG TPA: DUF1080 domain-containing protein [Fibrobacteria bacterium]|nr:DUF1080 domain-containing protein [Fibrobacteria bacterium]